MQRFSVLREEIGVDPEEFDLNYYTYGLKLYGNMPLMEPLESREVKKIREFVIAIDTSYSTSGTLVEQFLKETFSILTQKNSFFAQSKIRVIQCDNQVRSDVELRSERDIAALMQKFTVAGGGSTDFRPVFSYVNDLIERGELKNIGGLLYFTDGYGTFPAKMPPYDTAFIFMKDDYRDVDVPPWAIKLILDTQALERERTAEHDEYNTGKTGKCRYGAGVSFEKRIRGIRDTEGSSETGTSSGGTGNRQDADHGTGGKRV